MYEFLSYVDSGEGETVLLTCTKGKCVWSVVAPLVDFVIEHEGDESTNHRIFADHFLADHRERLNCKRVGRQTSRSSPTRKGYEQDPAYVVCMTEYEMTYTVVATGKTHKIVYHVSLMSKAAKDDVYRIKAIARALLFSSEFRDVRLVKKVEHDEMVSL